MDGSINITSLLSVLPVGPILWGLAVFVGILFLIHALITAWHWREYSTGTYTSAANMLVYIGVGLGFLVLMFLSALWYSLT